MNNSDGQLRVTNAKRLLETLIPICRKSLSENQRPERYFQYYMDKITNPAAANVDKFNNPQLKKTFRLKADGRPSWQLIVELKTATERRDQRAIM
ncbi:hypothetical protein DPMN_012129 [Dreissena polymorpha]|uniref:Uncharacterized protein n=1 Tax=Dreissena polymorpha TaxID=45954 RepID=A0A9D4S0N2_DREPO|nr:hypothetical protein DPMN_012129 [Dreissena polymorpha]